VLGSCVWALTHSSVPQVVANLELTKADGAMSAEGILDDPALFDPFYSGSKIDLAREYLALTKGHPATLRTVVFHVRRMLRDELNRFQQMDDCIKCPDVASVASLVDKLASYLDDPTLFSYDADKARREKEAKETRALEEGKRKAYEDRMRRKAKREGLDLEHYIRIGAELPTRETVEALRDLPREQQLDIWSQHHSQHCMNYHLGEGGCKRDRKCAFMHADIGGFVEKDEVAG